ncbi:MAG: hypothetical protein E4G98_03145 [Promethearchaeota archaeon]|nr:MAG: hypothetical protein E4G98_03145 [Candidatus Lokiarchaeota archaeon]
MSRIHRHNLAIVYLLTICLLSVYISCSDVTASFFTTSTIPAPRYGHQMVFDPIQNQLVLYGGTQLNQIDSEIDSTWLYHLVNQSWERLFPNSSPGKRINHGMIYEPETHRIILFGGMLIPSYDRVGDTWAFDPATNTWTELTPTNSPPILSDPAMYYDSDAQKVILFGGYLQDDTHSDETWAFDPATDTWERLTTSTPPEPRYGHSMVYDSSAHLGILFGGRIAALSGETWSFNSSSGVWHEIITSSILNPIRRYWFAMTFDPNLSQTILFGGDNEQSPLRALGDTWSFNAATSQWTELTSAISPLPRNGHAMTFASSTNQTFLFGGLGEDYSQVYGDFWTFNSTVMEWSQLSSGTEGTTIKPIWLILMIGLPSLGIITLVIILIQKRRMKQV